MALVDLRHLYVHLASNLETYRRFKLQEFSLQENVDGEIVKMIGGRRISVSYVGARQSYSVTLRYVERDDADWLRENMEFTMMFRTPQGELMWGRLFELSIQEEKLPGVPYATKVGNVSFVIESISDQLEA